MGRKNRIVALLLGVSLLTTGFIGSQTVKADQQTSNDTSEELVYWRFDGIEDDNEVRTVSVETKDVPMNETTAYVSTGKGTPTLTDVTNVTEGIYYQKYKNAAGNTVTSRCSGSLSGIKASEIVVTQEATVSDVNLDYTIDYIGNGILVEKTGNEKVYYAVETPNTAESRFEWKLLEQTITVPIHYDYTYQCIVTSPQPQLYEVKNSTLTNSTVNYIAFCKSDQSLVQIPNGYTAHMEEKTIRYEDTMEFYIIDTSLISEKSKAMNVYIKGTGHPKRAIERYSFYNANTGNLIVKYTPEKGFTLDNYAVGNGDVRWYNFGLVNVSAVADGSGCILWKTKGMQQWNVTTPNRINTDIPVDLFLENGTTLYFMDAINPTTTVKVKLPARKVAPTLTSKIVGEQFELTAFKKGYQIRCCTIESLEQNTGIDYLALPAEIGSAGDNNWYDYNYTSSGKNLDICKLAGIVENSNTNTIPGLCIEVRIGETAKVPSSLIKTIMVNEQRVLAMEEDTRIVLENGMLKISDASMNNQYEYCIEGVDKWIVIKNDEVKNKAIVPGCVIKLRKKAATADSEGIMLPSTYVRLSFTDDGSESVTYTGAEVNDIVNAP